MVPLNDFARQWADVRADVMEAVEAVGESGWYILGREVREFEAGLGAVWGLGFAAGTASGLDAIEISLRVLGCRAGDRVLTSPISAFATVLAILKIGAVPVFAGCDRFGLLDLDAANEACAQGGIRFCVPVHLYGHALDAVRLRALRDRFSLAMVEDCAQSIGASFRGEPTGSAGQMAAASFYPTKNLGAMGDAGAILSDTPALIEAACVLRDYGQSSKYVHERIGSNSRLDEVQAAILRRALLPRLARWTARRRAIAARYLERITNPLVLPVGAPPGSESCWHLFPVLVDPARKPAFLDHLRAEGAGCAEHYPRALFDQPVMREVEWECFGSCAPARRFCASEVSLPIHPYLGDDEVDQVAAACNRWTG